MYLPQKTQTVHTTTLHYGPFLGHGGREEDGDRIVTHMKVDEHESWINAIVMGRSAGARAWRQRALGAPRPSATQITKKDGERRKEEEREKEVE